MKMNVKGLVFVGFAAAVFAGAAQAAGENKTVTSLQYTEATYAKKTDLGAAAAKGVDANFNDTTSENLPTTAAVATYVGNQVSTAGGSYQTVPGANDGQKVAKAGGGWEALDTDATPTANSTKPVQSGGVLTALNAKANTADLGTAAAANVATNGVAASETGLVTGDQVNTAITTATNGKTVPATSTCTAFPCALVATAADTFSWEPIQQ